MKKFLEVGKVIKTHGIFGVLKVQHWCDDSFVFGQFKYLFLDSIGKVKKQIDFLNFVKDFIFLKFVDLNSIDDAKKYVGLVLYANRLDFKLPKGRVFIQDLLGASVVNYFNCNISYGKIIEVLNYGANDIYKIKNDDGLEFLIPVIDDIVVKKDLNRKLVFIKPMKGLFNV